MTPITPTRDDLWQTALFLPGAGPAAPDRISPRLAYQLLLHGRAVVVDLRGAAERAEGTVDPSLPVAATLEAALATGLQVVALAPAPGARTVDGGFAAWREAGLPVAEAPDGVDDTEAAELVAA